MGNVFGKISVLSHEEMQALHETALRILSEIGMRIDHEEALAYLDGAGCRVDKKSHVVRFPADVVEGECGAPARAVCRRTALCGAHPDAVHGDVLFNFCPPAAPGVRRQHRRLCTLCVGPRGWAAQRDDGRCARQHSPG